MPREVRLPQEIDLDHFPSIFLDAERIPPGKASERVKQYPSVSVCVGHLSVSSKRVPLKYIFIKPISVEVN
jgi:hypothetical protein